MKAKSKDSLDLLEEKKRAFQAKAFKAKLNKDLMERKMSTNDLANLRLKQGLESGLERTLAYDIDKALENKLLDEEAKELAGMTINPQERNIDNSAIAEDEEAVYVQKIKDIRARKAAELVAKASGAASDNLSRAMKTTFNGMMYDGCTPMVAAILTLAYVMAENGRLSRSILLKNTQVHE